MNGSTAVWKPAPTPPAASVLEAGGISPRLAPLLARRGVSSPEEARRFLDPRAEHLHPEELLPDVEAAVERLQAARDRSQKVVIVGDYDADGVSATALLLAVFRACGLEVEAILPDRMNEGYGFQPVHAQRAGASGASVVVTVDCGTTSHAAVEAALGLGLDVIVVDHHLPGRPLPPQVLLVNPKRGGEYPFDELAASGLAMKLALALGRRCGRELPIQSLLRVACLGTIADLVPLVDENRVIARLDLQALAGARSFGLRALLEQARVQIPVKADDIGFRIGPRLNAAGRLGSAHPALDLLLTRDPDQARDLARQLDQANQERQREELQVVEEATARVEEDGLQPILVASSPDWHRGVVGIAAGRLARRYHRPTILLSEADDEAVGSGRSIPGIHLFDFLTPWRERLVRFGGHEQAIGLTARRGELAALREEWIAAAGKTWAADALEKVWEYELDLAPGQMGPALLEELGRLEPHGQGNRRPLIRFRAEAVLGLRSFGSSGRHLKGLFRGEDGAALPFVAWRWAERRADLEGAPEGLGYLELDRWTGRPRLELMDARIPS